eukprot:TRINITY_DN6912_c0_g1_i1.p1 TRINITY_DN6912_c0_g1~~TRINITY_DN6912_c0_g1_i1.p1  ORF type:complete len:311 (+),score=25.90 TRINITY_DN6912_c0_g1_i1:121-1053(+)
MAELSSSGYKGLSGPCISHITCGGEDSACAGLTATGFSSLQRESFQALSSCCVRDIPSQTWSNATSHTISYLNGSSCGGLTWEAITSMSADAMKGITAECVSNFAAGLDGICILLGDSVGKLNPEACSGFQGACLGDAVAAFASNSPSIVKCVQNIDQRNMDGIFLSVLPPETFAALNEPQLIGLSTDACSYISGAQVAAINATQFSSLADCMRSLTPVAVRGITPAQIASLDPEQVGEFVGITVIQNLPQATFAALGLDQLLRLSPQARLVLDGEKYIFLFRKWGKELRASAIWMVSSCLFFLRKHLLP